MGNRVSVSEFQNINDIFPAKIFHWDLNSIFIQFKTKPQICSSISDSWVKCMDPDWGLSDNSKNLFVVAFVKDVCLSRLELQTFRHWKEALSLRRHPRANVFPGRGFRSFVVCQSKDAQQSMLVQRVWAIGRSENKVKLSSVPQTRQDVQITNFGF